MEVIGGCRAGKLWSVRLATRATAGRRVGPDMPGTAPFLWAGPPASPPGIILFLIPVLLVVVAARVVPKLAGEPAVVAVAVLAALWLLGAVTL